VPISVGLVAAEGPFASGLPTLLRAMWAGLVHGPIISETHMIWGKRACIRQASDRSLCSQPSLK